MVKACIRCQKTHSGPQSFLLTCFDCEKIWHHRCHQPPVPDSELIARIKAFTEGDIENGLDGWTCRRCLKKRNATHNNPSRPLHAGSIDPQKSLDRQPMKESQTLHEEKNSALHEQRDASALPQPSGPSEPSSLPSNRNLNPTAVPRPHALTPVQMEARMSKESDSTRSHPRLPNTTSQSSDTVLPVPQLSKAAPTVILAPELTSRDPRHPSTVTSSQPAPTSPSRIERTPSLPDQRVAPVQVRSEDSSAVSSHLLLNFGRSSTQNISNNGDTSATTRQMAPSSHQMEVDAFYRNSPAKHNHQPISTPVPPPSSNAITLKNELVPVWMHERHREQTEDSWDRAMQRKHISVDKPRTRCKPLARWLGSMEGESGIWRQLNFSIDDWVRMVK